MKRAWEYTGVLGMVPRRMIKFNKRITQILWLRLLPTKSTKHIVEPLHVRSIIVEFNILEVQNSYVVKF